MADFNGRLITLTDVRVFAAVVQHDIHDRKAHLVKVNEAVHVLHATIQHDITDRTGHLIVVKQED